MGSDVSDGLAALRSGEASMLLEIGVGCRQSNGILAVVVNFREHVGQQANRYSLYHHVAVNPLAELMGLWKTIFGKLPQVAAGQSVGKILVEFRMGVAIEIQAEILMAGRCIPGGGNIQVEPVELSRNVGSSLQAAGKPVNRKHLQVSGFPRAGEGVEQVFRPCR